MCEKPIDYGLRMVYHGDTVFRIFLAGQEEQCWRQDQPLS
jgi:hypothetical protein